MGFTGPEQDNGLVGQLGLELDERGNIRRDAEFRTNVRNVFVAGDAGRGQSLIVWAIAEGRSAAAAVDRFLGRQLQPRRPHRTRAHVSCSSDPPSIRALYTPSSGATSGEVAPEWCG